MKDFNFQEFCKPQIISPLFPEREMIKISIFYKKSKNLKIIILSLAIDFRSIQWKCLFDNNFFINYEKKNV